MTTKEKPKKEVSIEQKVNSLLPAEKRAELATTNSSATHGLIWAQKLVIKTPEVEASALEALAISRKAVKKLEEFRKFLVKPIKDHAKKIDDLFKTKARPAKETDTILTEKINRFREQVEADRQAEEEKKQAEWEKENKAARQLGGDAPEREAPQMEAPKQETARTSSGSVSTRKVWDFELEDLSKVPDAYKQLNTAQVRQAISNGVREISGLKIKQRDVLAVR